MTTETAPVFPPGRYGRRRDPRRGRRWLAWLLLAPVLVAGLWLAFRLYDQYADSSNYQSVVTGFTVINDQQVDVRYEVGKADTNPATCRLQATDQRSSEVGYAEVSVPAGSDVRGSYTLTTTARAYNVTVLGCSAAG
ncbi:DUF4307 domain-containing protein [Rugosimonospora africana]|uniref:DUF4307 domain-containing protein n=1 Tax=Rugosimonospora africana TaxID=556532 RepID=A0A8J3QLI7_9ACTN|nr:DUF4307 domain-containing protein [Rugosimonospora africana]GIH12049.1 hypothetical protein Raf01_02210 [Rugosimonospora africana]